MAKKINKRQYDVLCAALNDISDELGMVHDHQLELEDQLRVLTCDVASVRAAMDKDNITLASALSHTASSLEMIQRDLGIKEENRVKYTCNEGVRLYKELYTLRQELAAKESVPPEELIGLAVDKIIEQRKRLAKLTAELVAAGRVP